MKIHYLVLGLLFSLSAQAADLVTRPSAVGHRDYRRAKEVLPILYAGMEQTFYCGCNYRDKKIDKQSCAYRVRKDPARAARQEWEHIVPAWAIGHQRQCWKQGGRKHCSKNDAFFRQAEGDLVNLVPAVGEINADRSNFRYSVWSDNPAPMYGQCQTIVDFKKRRIQPRKAIRGSVARIQMHMHTAYGLRMSAQDRHLFCTWARAYPVNQWEMERQHRLVKLQGSGNRFVTDPDAVNRFCA